jgi:serine/threonine protein kinase/WD40 repeat protein
MISRGLVPEEDFDELLAEVADQFTEEIRRGGVPSVEEYAQRYTAIAPLLRQVLPALSVLGVGAGLEEGYRDHHTQGLLGDFQIIREIGRGGMGVVYEAEQISLGRRVALKVLPFAALLDKQQLARFRNEARAAATLGHPNIVAIHSVGCERGVHYYAMQLIEGHSLAEVIQHQRARQDAGRAIDEDFSKATHGPALTSDHHALSIRHPASAADTQQVAALSTVAEVDTREYHRTIAQLGIQAAQALDHAHRHGVLHRDVKPANLLVDNDGKLWITDFGLARLEQDAGMTMTGDLIGTLRYMSPEQALGKRAIVDHRTDIYSLGATLYELLTLEPAYPAEDRHAILTQIALGEPKKPRRINGRIPQDLETIVLKALEKDPMDRFATAKDLADDLKRFLDGRPTVARPVRWPARVVKYVRRRPSFAALALLIALAAASVAALNAWRVEQADRLQAESSQLRTLADQQRARAAAEEVVSRRLTYASRMRRAQGAWREGNLKVMREMLALYGDGSPDAGLRHFEWYYLNRLAHLPHRVCRGHNGEVYGVAFSRDGRTIVTGGQDATVRLWNADTGEAIAVLRGHAACIKWIDFSSDGDTFVTASDDGAINLWSLQQRRELATLTGHTTEVDACFFSDDGQALISVSHDLAGTNRLREVKLWDVAMRSVSTAWPLKEEVIQGLALSRSGKTLVTIADGKGAVWQREGKTYQLRRRIALPDCPGGLISSDEEFMLAPMKPHHLKMIRLSDGAVVNETVDEAGTVEGIDFSHASDRFATASRDSAVRVFRYPSGRLEHCLLGHTSTVWQVACSPTGNSLASVGADGTLRIWELEHGAERIHLKVPEGVFSRGLQHSREFAYLQNGRTLNAVYDGATLAWDVTSGRDLAFEELAGPRLQTSLESASERPFSANLHKLLPQWNANACFVRPRERLPDDPWLPTEIIRIVADGSRAIQVKDGRQKTWRLQPLQLLQDEEIDHGNPPHAVLDISRDGRLLCGVTKDNVIGVWGLDHNFFAIVAARGNAVFSPDGKRILCDGYDLGEYDTATGKLVRNYECGPRNGCNYSADAQRIAVISQMGFLTIYDTLTGEQTLRLDSGGCGALVFASDGMSLVACAADGGFCCWSGQK